MIHLDGFSYRYPVSAALALNDLDLSVDSGELLAVVGPNGAGKSTLCYALAGYIPQFFSGHASGGLRVAGRDALEVGPEALAGEVGLVFQDPFNQITGARFTVREEIAFGLENLGVAREEMTERIEHTLAVTGLEGTGDRSPYALSGGQQQRLALASVLVMDPSLLVLDEPTSQLDPIGTKEVFQAIHDLTEQRRTTVVLVEHKLEWVANFADRVLLLADGQAVALGPPDQVLTGQAALDSGVGETRFTTAARRAREDSLGPSGGPLPLTLEQAVEFFQ